MTRTKKTAPKTTKASRKAARVHKRGHWCLQDAKARFSELVRRVRSEGPQHVTVHGRDAVVVLSAKEFLRLKGTPTGAALIEAIQASPYRDVEIEPARTAMPVRDVPL
jgi:prevent-host-death family protein